MSTGTRNDAVFLAADWPAPANIVAGTTCRPGGVSQGGFAAFNLGAHVGDDPQAVAANRRRLRDLINLPEEPCWLRQVHGNQVVTLPDAGPEQEADACITTLPDTVCAVLSADCLPVLFARNDGRAVAAAHAGWRGLCAGVLEATVTAFDCDPARLMAWLGPAIAQAAFEVGEEVREQFIACDPAASHAFEANSAGRWQADLYLLAKHRLERAGVSAIFGGDRCTFSERDVFFSHRRNPGGGRMASLIYCRQ